MTDCNKLRNIFIKVPIRIFKVRFRNFIISQNYDGKTVCKLFLLCNTEVLYLLYWVISCPQLSMMCASIEEEKPGSLSGVDEFPIYGCIQLAHSSSLLESSAIAFMMLASQY